VLTLVAFRGRIRAHLRTPRCARWKNTEKIDKKLAKNAGKWRFLEGPRRHFAVLSADCTRIGTQFSARSYVHEARRAQIESLPPSRPSGATSSRARHQTIHVGPLRFHDCADFIAHKGIPRPPGRRLRLICGAPAGRGDGKSALSKLGRRDGLSTMARARSWEHVTSHQARNTRPQRGDRLRPIREWRA
jgi:hypothetical protein